MVWACCEGKQGSDVAAELVVADGGPEHVAGQTEPGGGTAGDVDGDLQCPRMTPPSPLSVGRQIAGPLSQMWGDGAGPTASALNGALASAGLDPADYPGNKADKVREALLRANDPTARRVAEELVELLRVKRVFEAESALAAHRIAKLRAAFEPVGDLSDSGVLTWKTPSIAATAGGPAVPPPAKAPARPSPAPVVHQPSMPPLPGDVPALPGIPEVVGMLRRLPEASRPLVGPRRKGKTRVEIKDEYDVQDFVHQGLRYMFRSVTAEDPMSTYAGAASRADFFVKAIALLVEVKVTSGSHGEKELRTEIASDQRSYVRHKDARHLIVVVYDLVGNIKDPEGFQDDLSDARPPLPSTVLVVRWPEFT